MITYSHSHGVSHQNDQVKHINLLLCFFIINIIFNCQWIKTMAIVNVSHTIFIFSISVYLDMVYFIM